MFYLVGILAAFAAMLAIIRIDQASKHLDRALDNNFFDEEDLRDGG